MCEFYIGSLSYEEGYTIDLYDDHANVPHQFSWSWLQWRHMNDYPPLRHNRREYLLNGGRV